MKSVKPVMESARANASFMRRRIRRAGLETPLSDLEDMETPRNTFSKPFTNSTGNRNPEIQSARASTAKIQIARDGLFDDIKPPEF